MAGEIERNMQVNSGNPASNGGSDGYFEDDTANLTLDGNQPRHSSSNFINLNVNSSQNQDEIVMSSLAYDQNSQSQSYASQSSDGRCSVILIKPTGENAKKLINNPVAIVKALKESSFSRFNDKQVRINKRKELIAIDMKSSLEKIPELLRTDKIGNWPVYCYQPKSDVYRYGVIYPVDRNADLNELLEMIEIPNSEIKALNLTRLKKKVDNTWVDSETIKITFKNDLPKDLIMGCSFYRVRPYVNMPTQCYKCQRIGHTSLGCNSKIRCLICSGEHDKKDCQASEPKCGNCGKNHHSNSSNCEYIQKAKVVEKIRAEKSCSYADALKRANSNEGGFSQQPQANRVSTRTRNDTSELNLTPNLTPQQYKNPRNLTSHDAEEFPPLAGQPAKQYATISTQTDFPIIDEKSIMDKVWTKMQECLTELFRTNLEKESFDIKKLMIKNAFTKSFGREMPTTPETIPLPTEPTINVMVDEEDVESEDRDMDDEVEEVISSSCESVRDRSKSRTRSRSIKTGKRKKKTNKDKNKVESKKKKNQASK